MSRSGIAWLGSLLLGVAAVGCAPHDGDHDPIETKQGAVTAVLFKPFATFSVGAEAQGVATGDLNGDGRADVAVTTSFGGGSVDANSLHVFLQAADGSLLPRVRYSLGNRPESIDIGDVNGDGRADVVVGNFSSSTVGVLLQNASGTLDAMVSYATPNSYAVKIGDFNSDGRMDVVAIAFGALGDGVDVFLQTAAGSLAPRVTYHVNHGGFDEVDVGDADGDGRTDVIVMSGQSNIPSVGVLPQKPDGTMGTPVYYSVGDRILTGGVAIGDTNGDGLSDIVVTYGGNRPNSFIGRFLQNATHTLNPVESFTSYDIPNPVVLADVDGDGRKDVLTAHSGWAKLGVYRQTSTGGLATEELYPITGASRFQPQGLAVGDVNGDALPDVVIADSNSGLVVLRHVDDVPPTVAITAPLGGAFCTGSALQLSWNAGDNVALSKFDVAASFDGGTTYVPVGGCTNLAATARSCTFTLATVATTRLRVTARDTSSNQAQSETTITVGTLAVHADQSTYAAGGTITATYTCLPGNADDWIAVAPAGAPNTSYLSYVFTGGAINGTATLQAPAAGGSFVLRAFPHNTYALLAESAPFSVPITISTNQSVYDAGSSITVTYSGLPGNADDWIALAPAGAPNTSYLSYVFTGGQISGTATLQAPATGGSYVIRAFPHNTYALLAQTAAFTVPIPATSVSIGQSTYEAGSSITVTYAGLPGNVDDWIAVAPAGGPNTSYLSYVFTGGQTSGAATLQAPATGGSYVIRAFPHNTFALLAESTAFSVPAAATTVSIGQSAYEAGATITVTFAGLPGNVDDWIAVAPAGAPNTSYLSYVFTGGQSSGTATLHAPAAGGSYVIRAFPHNTYALLAESTAFTVPAAAPTVSTDQATYGPGASITVTYAGLPGNADDWIAVATAGAPSTSYLSYVFTGGQTSGTATLQAPATAGSYVIRAFPNNTYALLAETPFSVSDGP